MKTIVLTIDDIRQIVNAVTLNGLMDDLIARLTDAFERYDPAQYESPARAGFCYAQPHVGLVEWMPIMAVGQQATIKVVGYHPANPDLHQLPTILATTSAYDTTNGHLIGLADSTFLTALRTGAASAVASRQLANPVNGVVGLIGTGAQAITQLHALARVFDVRHVLAYDIDPATAHSFAERASFIGVPIQPIAADRLNDLVTSADIICTATSIDVGAGPVFADGDTKPWLHVNAVGSDFPGKTELPRSLLQRSVVCPDFLAQALKEGECQAISAEEVGPTLIELMQQPPRADLRATTTVFDSTGWALEDQVALDMMMEYAADLHIGHFLQIEGNAHDPKDPYAFVKSQPTARPLAHTNGHGSVQ